MLVKTTQDGDFSSEWVSPTLESYIVNATWTGNSTYSSSSEIVDIGVIEPSNQTQLWIIVAPSGTITGVSIVLLIRKHYRRIEHAWT